MQYETTLQDGSQIQSGLAMFVAYVDPYWYSGTEYRQGRGNEDKRQDGGNYLCSYPGILACGHG